MNEKQLKTIILQELKNTLKEEQNTQQTRDILLSRGLYELNDYLQKSLGTMTDEEKAVAVKECGQRERLNAPAANTKCEVDNTYVMKQVQDFRAKGAFKFLYNKFGGSSSMVSGYIYSVTKCLSPGTPDGSNGYN